MRQINLFPNTESYQRLIEAINQHRRVQAYSLPFLTKAGERRMGVWSAEIVNIWDEACLLAAMADVTETRRLERALLAASERERQRIGRDLHDDLCPHLIGIEVLATVLEQRLDSSAPEAVAPVRQIRELIQEAIAKTRGLSRGLCPQPPQERPLVTLLETLALETHQLFGCECIFKQPDTAVGRAAGRTISAERAANCYYVAREALQNAVRHAGADRIEMRLDHHASDLILRIRDNGRGFDTGVSSHGLGLRSMAHRARLLDAELKVNSAPGSGTRVKLTIPCD